MVANVTKHTEVTGFTCAEEKVQNRGQGGRTGVCVCVREFRRPDVSAPPPTF